jgi:hypothetical protein
MIAKYNNKKFQIEMDKEEYDKFCELASELRYDKEYGFMVTAVDVLESQLKLLKIK